jgi:16S rRNA (guanine(1405)-N(7))-methyltransferase
VALKVLQRVAREALAIERRPADAVKRAKARLHQIHAAFAPLERIDAAARAVARLESCVDPPALEACCREVLDGHASTRERPHDLRGLYATLFELTGRPESVLDLGCGLHPFALPFMDLPRATPYHALDLDQRLVGFVDALFRKLGQEGSARAVDLLGDEPLPSADVALALKLLPTLEQQGRDAASRLLARVAARALVVSFSTRSIGGGGGRGRGMARQATELAERLLGSRGGTLRSLETPGELFFVTIRPVRAR